MHYTYQCDQLTLLYLSVPLLVYFNKLQNSLEIDTSKQSAIYIGSTIKFEFPSKCLKFWQQVGVHEPSCYKNWTISPFSAHSRRYRSLPSFRRPNLVGILLTEDNIAITVWHIYRTSTRHYRLSSMIVNMTLYSISVAHILRTQVYKYVLLIQELAASV